MRTRANQLWAVGGALAAAGLLAVAWFFFISPRNSETASLRDQTQLAQDQLPILTRRLGELRQQNTKLADFQAELARYRQALPTSPAEPDLVRSLHAAATNANASLTGITVGTPTKSAVLGSINAIPVALDVEGPPAALLLFVNQLQQVQPRAVLVKTSSLEGGADKWTLTLQTEVYYAATAAEVPAK
jgi:Tfp pilus assembly protein PilO